MTLKDALALKPGDKLIWKGKGEPRRLGGATAHQIFAKKEGETVEFLDFTGENDIGGLPIIRIKGKSGEGQFSSCWFV